MGGTMKGAAHGSCRRKWSSSYVVMAIVCCVLWCGILGLMGIQRLKERGSFNLIIKERDDQIVSIHLLLQKERELAAEARREAAETRRSERAKVSELESTVSSLREEQRAVESAFQERANLMREKCDQQLEALKEELRRRGGEVEELKLRLQPGSSNATAGIAEVVINGNGGEVVATGEKGHEHEKAGEEETEAERSPRRFGGRLRRAKGRRWGVVGKQMQGKRNESALGEAEKSSETKAEKISETKVEAREGEETGEAISIEKPAEEKRDTDVRKGGGEEENGDQGEESEEANEPEI